MAKCFCGEYGVSTSKRTYDLCLSHMRQMLESAYKENKDPWEEKLYDALILSPDRDWNITEYVIDSLINAVFFSGDKFEYLVPNEYISDLEE